VIGTTGWDTSDKNLHKLVEDSGIGVMVGSNFSAGAQIFFQLVASAAKLFSRINGYDVYGLEVHHSAKKDSPSGTAKTIAAAIIDNFPSKTTVNYDRIDDGIDSSELHFASVRAGRNPGMHEVMFDSSADEVRLTHAAHNREGFAGGAILAAEYIHGKQGFMFFEQLFEKGGLYGI